MRIKVRLNKDVKVTIIGADSAETKQLLRDLGVIVTCQGCHDGKDPPGPGFNPFDGVAEIECPVCQLSAADRAGRARTDDSIAKFEKLVVGHATHGFSAVRVAADDFPDDDAQEVGVNGGNPAWWHAVKESSPDPVKAGTFSPARPTGPTEDEKDAIERAEEETPPELLPSKSITLAGGVTVTVDPRAAEGDRWIIASTKESSASTALNPPAGLRGWVSTEEDIAAAGRKPLADLPLAAKLEVENQLRAEGILGQQGPVANMTVTDQQRALAQEVGNQLAYRQWGQQQSILNIAQATQDAQGEAKTEPKPSSPSEPAIEPPAKTEAPSSASLKVPAGVIVSCKGNRWTWRCTVPAWVGSSTQKWPTRDAARQDAIRWLESDPPLADKHGSYDPDVFDRTREREKWPEGFRIYFALGKWQWENQGDEHGVSIPFATYREALDSLRSVEPAADIQDPAPPPPMAAMLPDAKAKEEAALVAPKEAFYIHPGAGWGPLEDGGLVKHLVCNGKGCTGCNRQGYKRCLEKPKRAFKVF